ncbi:MAG: intradiol ring-cleavage dioxygenase [Bacteroidetes bacterium]|nr:intradiol ring-cleavage dioxygenase [Bacteroidota bacterium]
MKSLLPFLFYLGIFISACAQSAPPAPQAQQEEREVGGYCEGCEATLEYGDRKLTAVDTMPDFWNEGPKIKVTGTIYKPDGKTPAEGVILYVHHTDQTGVYPPEEGGTLWARRHGKLRTWLKTGADGRYTFYTLRPASYPGTENPAHIHPFIKEDCCIPYYIAAYYFEDDPYLTDQKRNAEKPRGGSGVLLAEDTQNGVTVYQRDIVLGLHVEDY